MKYTILVKYISSWLFLTSLILILGPRKWFPEFYEPRFMGLMILISAFLPYLPPKILNVDTNRKKIAMKKFQGMLAISLTLNGLGELGLYKMYEVIGFPYDKLAHFLVSMILTFGAYYLLRVWGKISLYKSILASLFLVLVLGLVWEMLEALSDFTLHTKIWGYYGNHLWEDTFGDIISDILGSLVGAMILYLKHKNIILAKPVK